MAARLCDLVLIQSSLLLLRKSSCSYANQAHLHDKSREVCIKGRLPPALAATQRPGHRVDNYKMVYFEQKFDFLCRIPEAFSPICTTFYSYAAPLSIRQNSLGIYLLWRPWVEIGLENNGWLSTRPETSKHLTQE